MRLDVFLKKTLILKKRSDTKRLCSVGLIKVNGTIAKPAKEVKVDDLIEIETIKGVNKYRIIMLPEGNVRKNEVSLYYEVLN
ncbi:MAG: S4 domain-containing protein [candidate division WOR-3 bacterium]